MSPSTLYPDASARAADPIESHEAAGSVDVWRSHRLVVDALRGLGQATSEAIYAKVAGQTSPGRARGAIAELTREGAIERCGTGRTERNRACAVYRLAGNTESRD